jgi:hypothetical protein
MIFIVVVLASTVKLDKGGWCVTLALQPGERSGVTRKTTHTLQNIDAPAGMLK